MSNQYPLIKSLNLPINTSEVQMSTPTCYGEQSRTTFKNVDFVRCADLEKLLAEGVRVRGSLQSKKPWDISAAYERHDDTHSGLIIGYKEIEKPKAVTKAELLKALKFTEPVDETSVIKNLIKRIESAGVSND